MPTRIPPSGCAAVPSPKKKLQTDPTRAASGPFGKTRSETPGSDRDTESPPRDFTEIREPPTPPRTTPNTAQPIGTPAGSPPERPSSLNPNQPNTPPPKTGVGSEDAAATTDTPPVPATPSVIATTASTASTASAATLTTDGAPDRAGTNDDASGRSRSTKTPPPADCPRPRPATDPPDSTSPRTDPDATSRRFGPDRTPEPGERSAPDVSIPGDDARDGTPMPDAVGEDEPAPGDAEPVPDEPDEPVTSAYATPAMDPNTTPPTPNATANAPMRPTYAPTPAPASPPCPTTRRPEEPKRPTNEDTADT